MKTKCAFCGKEFDFEENEDWQECNMCNGTGIDEAAGMCIFCNGSGSVDLCENELPFCEECCYREEEEDEANE